MHWIALICFARVKWQSRQGLRDLAEATDEAKKHEALQIGVRGERYVYWYLRRLGNVFIARNYMPLRVNGELDLIGYDGENVKDSSVVCRAHEDFMLFFGDTHFRQGRLPFEGGCELPQ